MKFNPDKVNEFGYPKVISWYDGGVLSFNFSVHTYLHDAPLVVRQSKVVLHTTNYYVYNTAAGDPFCTVDLRYDVGWFASNDVTAHCMEVMHKNGCFYLSHNKDEYTISFGQNVHLVTCEGMKGGVTLNSIERSTDWLPLLRVSDKYYGFYEGFYWYAVLVGGLYKILSPQVMSLGLSIDGDLKRINGVHLNRGKYLYFRLDDFVIASATTIESALTYPSVLFYDYEHGDNFINGTYNKIDCEFSDCPCDRIIGNLYNAVQVTCNPEFEKANNASCWCLNRDVTAFLERKGLDHIIIDEHEGWAARIFGILLNVFTKIFNYILSLLLDSAMSFRLYLSVFIFVIIDHFSPSFYLSIVLTLAIMSWSVS